MANSDSVNNNINLLYKFNLSDKNSLSLFNKSTRDNANLNVLKCKKSGVIVLEKFLTSESYYEKNIYYTEEFEGSTATVFGDVKSKPLNDDIRRYETYKDLILDSEILDFGCGKGGFIELSNKISKRSVGLEINKENRRHINEIGINCVGAISELNNDKFDLITLNHVFEHLNDPINILKDLQRHLKDDGLIIIEVPHARDILLETFNLESFKKFTLWSEHLILHTRKSLETFVLKSGLHTKKIEGYQRYPLSNHFNWLLNGKPSGHEIFHNLNSNDFHNHYSNFLNTIDQTDTLVGYFKKI